MTKLKRNIRSSQGLPEAMGFSILPHSHSAIAISNRLTGSQFRLWHYLMMIDPFADQTRNGEKIYHPIPSPAEIAVAIGASQRTVEKDMKRLEELGLYAKRITQWEGYNTTAEAGKAAATKLKNKSVCPEPLQDKGGYLTADPAKQPDIALNSREPGYLAADPAKQPDIALNSREQPLEPLQHKDSSVPQTIQTYTDFINTLSDSERESFVKFGEQKAKQLPRPPELPQRWVEKNWEELSAQWHKESGKTSKAQTEKWENHPQRQEWIEKIRHLGPLGFQAETNDRDEQKQRRDFAKWATDNKLIWGMES
ncbi:helix-turn-helix domain-containing protein [Aetokthonos hydrillicola Thurmond2011]|jgi:DNA-binding transcriptional ArsR family regulator|uniref:Helix-turn-helix domain-containing protein n=1 Tax=Aetokthonos hydrillicola Thurmond2011 TaxID=2712845 RepID=A0AAP5MA29_9CYAN|nr:hypothetical protein [Aetokthonos hydrillicola]MBO3458496.1 hypothetical protein [Aetokthonos hydrillicola CCALA 1050]MBW4586177.1 helix-turn-helix domain-containing protein [Aetokthonos hydrillicola CCALA 1050]MDR9897785.1 helix-turn-helix domain-containing protein [Aetokthonos hydrillicola Thurmond2011]